MNVVLTALEDAYGPATMGPAAFCASENNPYVTFWMGSRVGDAAFLAQALIERIDARYLGGHLILRSEPEVVSLDDGITAVRVRLTFSEGMEGYETDEGQLPLMVC